MAAQAALAVDHEGQHVRGPAEPAGRAELAERPGPLALAVGHQAQRLAGRRHSPGPAHRRLGVRLGALEVVGLEQGRHHHQVLGHALGVLLAQGAQLLVHRPVELLAGHALGDAGLGQLGLLGRQPWAARARRCRRRRCPDDRHGPRRHREARAPPRSPRSRHRGRRPDGHREEPTAARAARTVTARAGGPPRPPAAGGPTTARRGTTVLATSAWLVLGHVLLLAVQVIGRSLRTAAPGQDHRAGAPECSPENAKGPSRVGWPF